MNENLFTLQSEVSVFLNYNSIFHKHFKADKIYWFLESRRGLTSIALWIKTAIFLKKKSFVNSINSQLFHLFMNIISLLLKGFIKNKQTSSCVMLTEFQSDKHTKFLWYLFKVYSEYFLQIKFHGFTFTFKITKWEKKSYFNIIPNHVINAAIFSFQISFHDV